MLVKVNPNVTVADNLLAVYLNLRHNLSMIKSSFGDIDSHNLSAEEKLIRQYSIDRATKEMEQMLDKYKNELAILLG